jgi:hypothetical protein
VRSEGRDRAPSKMWADTRPDLALKVMTSRRKTNRRKATRLSRLSFAPATLGGAALVLRPPGNSEV